MRISWGGWLATALLAGVAVGQNNYINFTKEDLEDTTLPHSAAILTPSMSRESDILHTVGWTILPEVRVKDLTLFAPQLQAIIGYISYEGTDGATAPVSHPTDDAGSGLMEVSGPTKPGNSLSDIKAREADGEAITAVVGTNGLPGTITITDVKNLSDSYAGKEMYFQVRWTLGGWKEGTSYSRMFSVAQNKDQATAFANANSEFANDVPAKPESISGNGSPTSTSTMIAATKSSVPGSSGGSNGDSNHSSGSAKQIGGGGLSTGAIAGIAVGAGIVGIVATVGLIWLLIRRRRRQQALAGGVSGGPYGSHGNNRTQELMAEKEANGGVDVSPHSPYSDDGNTAAAASTTVAAAAAAGGVGAAGASMSGGGGGGAAHDRAFTPYSDHQRSSLVDEAPTTAPPAAAAAASHGRSTPSAAQTPYGHLVEDGMTEDDIRRLEAEERELDQAIEQAGRRS